MKTQLRKPARSKASYTDQYKQEALELWRNSGRSATKVAAELEKKGGNPHHLKKLNGASRDERHRR